MIDYLKLIEDKIIDRKTFLLNYYHLINISEVEVLLILQIESLLEKNLFITNLELEKVMNINASQIDKHLASLLKKNYLRIDEYNPSNIIDTSNLYNIINDILLGNEIIKNENIEKELQQNMIKVFEKEFNRHLTPFEIDMVRDWYTNYNDELIIYALKEAVMNGVLNMKYIDKIIINQERILNG